MKYLIIDQTTYSEQMYTRLLNLVDNYYSQHYKGLIILQWTNATSVICFQVISLFQEL